MGDKDLMGVLGHPWQPLPDLGSQKDHPELSRAAGHWKVRSVATLLLIGLCPWASDSNFLGLFFSSVKWRRKVAGIIALT